MVNFCLIWDETPSAVGQKLVMKCLPIIGQISNPKEQLIYVWHQSLTRQPQPLKSASHPPLAWLTLTKLPGGTGNFLTHNSSCISLLRFLGSALRFEVRFYLLCQNITPWVKVAQLRPTLWDPMDYTVHGILQARRLACISDPFSRGSSQPRYQTQVSHVAGGFFINWATREAHTGWKIPCLT